MPSWPATLPQEPLINTLDVGSPTNVIIRSKMSAGPPKSRRRSTAGTRPVRADFSPLTEAQVLIFEAFYKNDIALGALAFTMPHPITEQPVSVRFAGEDGHFAVSVVGKNAYQISLNLEIMP